MQRIQHFRYWQVPHLGQYFLHVTIPILKRGYLITRVVGHVAPIVPIVVLTTVLTIAAILAMEHAKEVPRLTLVQSVVPHAPGVVLLHAAADVQAHPNPTPVPDVVIPVLEHARLLVAADVPERRKIMGVHRAVLHAQAVVRVPAILLAPVTAGQVVVLAVLPVVARHAKQHVKTIALETATTLA